MEKARQEAGSSAAAGALGAIEDKLRSDLGELRRVIAQCRRCRGAPGVPGHGEPGARLFLLAGRPGPGAAPGNPWGAWRDALLGRLDGKWGLGEGDMYFSTALRCVPPKVTGAEIRRCAGMLAEELFIVGPRLVLVSGKVAAVALRAALGVEVPGAPKAGDDFRLFGMAFLFDLDVARVESERDAARVFWSVLDGAGEFL